MIIESKPETISRWKNLRLEVSWAIIGAVLRVAEFIAKVLRVENKVGPFKAEP